MTKKENELRESCFALARGRIPAEKILAMADILAKEYDLPLERVGEIVRESVAVATSKDQNITKEVGEWIAQSEGTFRISDIYFDLAIGQGDKEAKNSVRVALARLKKEKIIESGSRHSGEYRKVVDECVKVDFLNAPIDPVFLKWPFELENVVNIFEKNIVVLAGKSNEGKGHPMGTKILTPTGWTKIEKLKVGDMIFSEQGKQEKITGVYKRGLQQCFEFVFNDRTSLICDFEHLWNVLPAYNRCWKKTGRGNPSLKYGKYEVLPAYKILAEVGGFGKIKTHLRLRLPKNEAIDFEEKEISSSLDPYFLGLLLGDGSLSKTTISISAADEEIIDYCRNYYGENSIYQDKRTGCFTVSFRGLKRQIEKFGLVGCRSWEKFIPKEYLLNCIPIRKDLLAGLLDSDGDISESGQISFNTVSEKLCEDFVFLARSLGIKVTVTSRLTHYRYLGQYKTGRLSYRIRLKAKDFCPFRLTRKARRYKIEKKSDHKSLCEIKNAGIQETICISTSAESGLYIAKDFIVTHNTAFLLNFAKMNMDKFEVHYFSSEMGDSETRLRLTQFQDIKIEEWKINVWDRTEHFEDVIRPDAVNCIDYLESLTGEEYKVKAYISRIWNKLNKGVAVIAIQKNEQTDFGRGGQATMDKARLYLAINPGVIKIVKAKNWTDGENNPNGKIQTFKLIGGWKFIVDGLGWRTPEADDIAADKTKYSKVHKYKNIGDNK